MDAGHLPIALQMKSKLLDLVELKNAGAITEDEFVANKRELLASAVSTSTISMRGYSHALLAGNTDGLQPVDGGVGALLKREQEEVHV